MPKKQTKPPEWKLCEISKSAEYQKRGCLVLLTGKGSDFLAICPDKKTTFVEVKKGCGQLTRLQSKTRKNVLESGFLYKIERCACSRPNKKTIKKK